MKEEKWKHEIYIGIWGKRKSEFTISVFFSCTCVYVGYEWANFWNGRRVCIVETWESFWRNFLPKKWMNEWQKRMHLACTSPISSILLPMHKTAISHWIFKKFIMIYLDTQVQTLLCWLKYCDVFFYVFTTFFFAIV